MNDPCCKHISNKCDGYDFCKTICCCSCPCCDRSCDGACDRACDGADFGNSASDGRITAIDMHPVFGSADTVLWGGAYRADVFSDGVTADLSDYEVLSYLVMNDITITSIKLTSMFLFFDGVCQPNEIDHSFGLYEAQGDSKIFSLIPESKIVFDRKVIPPFDRSRHDKTSDGLNIRTSRDNKYFFGLHYEANTAGDRPCGLILHSFGSYAYI